MSRIRQARWSMLIAVFSLVPFLSALALPGAPSAAAASSQSISVDGNSPGRVFDGVGALSAGASSRLLIDYPPQQRSQILDYLFKPGYGASLQILKTEIGGDTNSTDGSELSHEPQQGKPDCNLGYEWWLMEQAKKLNPSIKLYGLEWGAPGWVGAGTGTLWTTQNIDYLLDWLGCAREHGLTIDYLGGWNESYYDPSWFVQLRQALDQHGYSNVQIVAADDHEYDNNQNWDVAAAMASDPAFDDAVSAIGIHYPCVWLSSAETCPDPPNAQTAQTLGKPLWASEDGSLPYDTGAAPLARELNRQYISDRVTATINWSLVWSAYSDLPYEGDGLMLANSPWSGDYQVGKSIWVMAHTAQFAQPGWRYLDSAAAMLSGGGSTVSLASPDHSDYSTITETSDATKPQTVTYNVANGLSDGPVHVWESDLNSSNPADYFRSAGTVPVRNGSYTMTLQPGYIYTFTTTTGQHKGSATAPPASAWKLPYTENFNEYPADSTPHYLSDLEGAFQTEPCTGTAGAAGSGGGQNMCLQQTVAQQPVKWHGAGNYPVTVIGDPAWSDYRASVDAMLPQSGSVDLVARALGQANGTSVSGYHFRISDQGQWSISAEGTGTTTLASGTASFGTGTWHRLGLEAQGDEITASLDGRKLGTVLDSTYQAGQVGLETSPWATARFDNLSITPAPVASQAKGPALAVVSPSPVQMAAPGSPATLTTAVTNPGGLPATAVSAQLQLPAGWTASTVTPAPAVLAAGQSAPLAWKVSAPASASPGVYQATAVVTYAEGGLTWIAKEPVTIDLEIVPQSQMSASSTNSQDGYPPGNAIDGDPNTLWHTEWSPVRATPPQSITLDLGGSYNVSGLTYLPRQDGNGNGIITSYQILVSQDGTTFTEVASGNWAEDATLKQATFPAQQARYVRLTGVQGGNGYVSAAEINVIGSPAS